MEKIEKYVAELAKVAERADACLPYPSANARAAVSASSICAYAALSTRVVDMPQFDEDGYRQKRALETEQETAYAERDKETPLR